MLLIVLRHYKTHKMVPNKCSEDPNKVTFWGVRERTAWDATHQKIHVGSTGNLMVDVKKVVALGGKYDKVDDPLPPRQFTMPPFVGGIFFFVHMDKWLKSLQSFFLIIPQKLVFVRKGSLTIYFWYSIRLKSLSMVSHVFKASGSIRSINKSWGMYHLKL